MIFAPAPIGRNTLAPDILSEDKKGSRKIGPCALGKRAMYLNSFFVDRRYYVLYGEVSRAFKRVAMSKGGFTGKGAFGSIPYLVVQLKNGREQQCNFKYEEQVDTFLSALNKQHPEIKTVSAEAEKRLLAERAKEEARYVKHLSPAAEETLETLKAARGYLEKEPEIPARLAGAAKDKRIMDRMNPAYRYAAAAIFLLALGALVFGIISIFRHQGYGRIITVSSVMGILPLPYQVFYSSAKAALLFLTEGLAMELDGSGIECCCVLPGDVATGFTSARKLNEAAKVPGSPYASRMKKNLAKIEKDELGGMSPAVIGRSILGQLQRRHMRARVIPRIDYGLIGFVVRICPVKWRLKLVNLLYN